MDSYSSIAARGQLLTDSHSRNSEPPPEFLLDAIHLPVIPLVIIPHQVQNTVQDEDAQFFAERAAVFAGVALGGFGSNGDVAQEELRGARCGWRGARGAWRGARGGGRGARGGWRAKARSRRSGTILGNTGVVARQAAVGGGKREDVRGAFLTAVLLVPFGDFGVADEGDGDFRAGDLQFA